MDFNNQRKQKGSGRNCEFAEQVSVVNCTSKDEFISLCQKIDKGKQGRGQVWS